VTRLGEFSPIGRLLTMSSFVANYRSSQNIRATLFHCKSYELILTKKWLGYILVELFTNSSGHCGPRSCLGAGIMLVGVISTFCRCLQGCQMFYF
jgi:hypothetical protein